MGFYWELSAVLDRDVYLPGDEVCCYVQVRKRRDGRRGSSRKDVSLAWLSLQLLGRCVVNRKYGALPFPRKPHSTLAPYYLDLTRIGAAATNGGATSPSPSSSSSSASTAASSSGSRHHHGSGSGGSKKPAATHAKRRPSAHGNSSSSSNSGPSTPSQAAVRQLSLSASPAEPRSHGSAAAANGASTVAGSSSSSGSSGSISSKPELPEPMDSGGANSGCLFASPPTVLQCALHLDAAGTAHYRYYVTLPQGLPPSYKAGACMKYTYGVGVTAQCSDGQQRTLSVAVRVLNPYSALARVSFTPSLHAAAYATRVDVLDGAAQPLLADAAALLKHVRHTQAAVTELPPTATAAVPRVTATASPPHKQHQHQLRPQQQQQQQQQRRQGASSGAHSQRRQRTLRSVNTLYTSNAVPATVSIAKDELPLASFSVNRTAFALGDTVSGTLDFRDSEVSCYQVSVSMVTIEQLEGVFARKKPVMQRRTVLAEFHEYTLHTLKTNFRFQLTLDMTPEFYAEHSSLKWQLEFQFITGAKQYGDNVGGHATGIPPPQPVDILSWSYPIRVLVPRYPARALYKRHVDVMKI